MFVSNVLFSFGIAKVDIFSLPPNFLIKILQKFVSFMQFARNKLLFVYICSLSG